MRMIKAAEGPIGSALLKPSPTIVWQNVQNVISCEDNETAAAIMLYDIFSKAGSFDAFLIAYENKCFGMYHTGRNLMGVLERLLNHNGADSAPPIDVVRFALWFALKELNDIGIINLAR